MDRRIEGRKGEREREEGKRRKEGREGGGEEGGKRGRGGPGAPGTDLVVALKPRRESPGCVSTAAPQAGPRFPWPMSSLPSQFCRLQKL